MVHQNSAHRLGPDREEMGAVAPIDPGLIDELEKRLVHQRRGLERVTGSLLAHVLLSQPAQVLVNHVDQFGELRSVAVLDRRQQLICVVRHAAPPTGSFTMPTAIRTRPQCTRTAAAVES